MQINQSIERLYNNLELLHKSLENLYVKAPASGKLSSFNAKPGETKSLGSRIGQIEKQGGYKIMASIDENYIGRINTGQKAIYIDNVLSYELQVVKIYTEVRDGIFKADLIFLNDVPNSIKNGQSVQLKLKLEAGNNSIMIKHGSYYHETGGKWIYVVDTSGKIALKRKIVTGKQNIQYYQIINGLDTGEKIIISSYEEMKNKDMVVLSN